MTIKIDPQLRDSLILRIADGLKHVKFEFGSDVFPSSFRWALELNKLLNEESLSKILKFCGSDGIADFLYSEVSRFVTDNSSQLEETEPDFLTEVDEFADPIVAARNLVDSMLALPRSYRVTVTMPRLMAKATSQFLTRCKLRDGFELLRGLELPADFPLQTGNNDRDRYLIPSRTGNEGNGDAISYAPSDDGLYLEQRLSGYVGDRDSTPVLAEAADNLRCLLGACTAVGLTQFFSFGLAETSSARFVVHRMHNKKAEIVHTEELPTDLLSFYSRAYVRQRPDDVPLAQFQKDWTNRLELVQRAFGDTDHCRRLYTACVWYLRSHLSADTLDSLLESTISIEALLGDRQPNDRGPLSDLLGNRCAYLLGRSVTERGQILESFKRIYKLRSNIVHTGKHSIEPLERRTIRESRELCGKIIRRELHLNFKASSQDAAAGDLLP